MIYYSKRIPREISEGKRPLGPSLGETKHKLPRAPSPWRQTGHAQLQQQQIQKHTWNVYWRSLSETQNPMFLLDTGNVDTICLAHNNIPDSQKESSVRCERHWLHKQFSHSKPPLSVREWWKLPKSKFPATSPGPALQVQACLSKASSSDLLPYLFSAQTRKQRSSPWRRLAGRVPLWIEHTPSVRKRAQRSPSGSF